MASRLRLRPVRIADEEQFLAAQNSLRETDDYLFGLHYDQSILWPDYVALLANRARGVDLPDRLVADTFLIAVVNEEIVGRVSIRHELNEFLAREGGHIGYAVLKPHRRKGYATEILDQTLVVARSLGIEVVLLVCDENNVGSVTVIERCGGTLRDRGESTEGVQIRRYDVVL